MFCNSRMVVIRHHFLVLHSWAVKRFVLWKLYTIWFVPIYQYCQVFTLLEVTYLSSVALIFVYKYGIMHMKYYHSCSLGLRPWFLKAQNCLSNFIGNICAVVQMLTLRNLYSMFFSAISSLLYINLLPLEMDKK